MYNHISNLSGRREACKCLNAFKAKEELGLMPCPKCGTLAIQFGAYTVCPACEKIPLLKRREAIFNLLRNEEQIELAVFQIMRTKLYKNDLLMKLLWAREDFCRSLYEKYQVLDTNKFLSSNLLILRITRDNLFSGTIKGTENDVESIVNGFKRLIESKETRLILMQGLGEPFQLFDKIHVLFNERYFPILATYEDNDIWQQPKANMKIDEYSKILEIEMKKEYPKEKYSPKRFVEVYFPLIHQFYCCFLRNEIYREVFGLLGNYKADVNPQMLLNFVNSYPMNEKALFHTSLPEFITRAKKYFGLPRMKIKELLLFNEKNTNTFPLFLEINGRVYISHRTSLFLVILLHAIIYKDLFDQETVKQSREFEKQEVKESFEKIGWSYLTNRKDKKKSTIEIDRIAISKNRIVVIECKGWKLKPFYEYQTQQDYLIRDIKGIIIGEKYTNKTPKKIPSLIEKLNYVRANLQLWGLDKTQCYTIDGIVVLRHSPPILEYKGIHVLGIKEIAKKYSTGT